MSWVNTNKSNNTWTFQVRGGRGWLYDQSNLTYDSVIDNISQDAVLYDSIGYPAVWVNTNKSSNSWSNQTKH